MWHHGMLNLFIYFSLFVSCYIRGVVFLHVRRMPHAKWILSAVGAVGCRQMSCVGWASSRNYHHAHVLVLVTSVHSCAL